MKYYFTGIPAETRIVCSINSDDKTTYYQAYRIDNLPEVMQNTWNSVSRTFDLHRFPTEGFLKIYVWEINGDTVYIDNLHVKMYLDF